MKILVVDDDPQILEAVSIGFQLQWQDCTVTPAVDGESGLHAFYEQDPDVVVLDVTLPGKNGFEILQEIRRISDVPVIMLTARGEEMAQVRGLELGADDYVVKPFSHLALLARIKAVLRRAELPPPVRALPDFVAGDLSVNFQNHQVMLRGTPVKLTPVEYKLLYHLVRNAGRLIPTRRCSTASGGPTMARRLTTSRFSSAAYAPRSSPIPLSRAISRTSAGWVTASSAPAMGRQLPLLRSRLPRPEDSARIRETFTKL
jgi:DNA-binding response OmpR family regulator